MTLEEAIRKALPLVRHKKKHRHYAHVVKLANKLYRPLVTGKNADHLIHRFNKRETVEDHKQRVTLTVLITSAISNTLMAPVRKIGKVRPAIDKATYEDEASDKQVADATSKFFAGKSVDHYLSSVLLDQGAIDPNAFCLVLFDDFESRVEKARPYPSIISCEDAWNYEYINGELAWLLVHRTIQYQVKPKAEKKPTKKDRKDEDKRTMNDGDAFWFYSPNHHILFSQVDDSLLMSPIEGVIVNADGSGVEAPSMDGAEYYYRPNKGTLYSVKFYEHKAGMVQAFRLGFRPDQRTRGETMVNMWHAAVPFMLKGVKAGSELDISAAMHAFLQKLQYSNRCNGYTDPKGVHTDCNNGFVPGGDVQCKACNGDGYINHASGMDHITLSMPRTKDEFLELENIVRYVQLPVEVIQWQDGYVDKLERKCYSAVYNSDRFKSATALQSETATGELIDLDNIYDTIKPAADWWSEVRVRIYKLTASYVISSTSLDKFTCIHQFPRNLRFESTSERIALLKALREASASPSSVAAADKAVQQDIFIDDPEGLQEAMTRDFFNPFNGMSESAIVTMISQDNTPKAKKVFWVNQHAIYAEAVLKYQPPKENFWAMARSKQKKILDDILEEYLKAMEEEAAASMERQQLGMGDGGDPAQGGATGDGSPASTGNGTGDTPNSPGSQFTE